MKGRSFKRGALLINVLILFTLPVFGAEEKSLLAVLEMEKGAKVPGYVDTYVLTEIMRQEAFRTGRFMVMTKENVWAMLKASGRDPAKCAEDAQCAVDYGRVLGADWIITSKLRYVEGMYILLLQLYNVGTGFLKGSVIKTCKNCTYEDLMELTRKSARELFGEKEGEGVEEKEAEVSYLTLSTEPGGAEVYVDGKKIGETPVKKVMLSPGEHRVKVTKKGYSAVEEEITLEKGKEKERHIKLSALMGKIAVNAIEIIGGKGKNIKAEIYVDGEKKGETPDLIDVKAGRREIVISAGGGRKWKKEIEIKPGETKNLTARFIGVELKKQAKKVRKIEKSIVSLSAGYLLPFGDVQDAFGGGGIIDLSVGVYSLDGFYTAVGTKYMGGFSSKNENLILAGVEGGYYVVRGKKVQTALITWIAMGYYFTDAGGGAEGFSMEGGAGVKVRFPYFSLKTGISLYGFGGKSVPAIFIGGGVDIW